MESLSEEEVLSLSEEEGEECRLVLLRCFFFFFLGFPLDFVRADLFLL